jgi:hypothetical protein
MPSQRRIKVFGVLVFLFIVTMLFWHSSSQTSQQDLSSGDEFYAKTVNALDKKEGAGAKVGKGNEKEKADDAEVAKAMSQRLKEAAQVAKNKANAKAPKPDPPSSVIGMGSAAEGAAKEKSVAGRKKYVAGDAQEVVKEEKEEEEVETPERRAAKTELNKILKKAPSKYSMFVEFICIGRSNPEKQ